MDGIEGGNRQNKLSLESRTPSWAGLWALSYLPSIYGNDLPTGKPGPWEEEPQGTCLDSPPKRIIFVTDNYNYLCKRIESYILLCLLRYDHRSINNCPMLTT